MGETLLVHEIYASLQGESTFAGLPCVFVRLTGCNLRCSYCDTVYAFRGGERMDVDEVVSKVRAMAKAYGGAKTADGGRLPIVEVTGGEPLLQARALPLLEKLCDEGWTVLLETSGAVDASKVDARVRRVFDVKCPSSGEAERNCWANFENLRETDEVKFVIGSVEDYEYAREVTRRLELASRCPVLFSWVYPIAESQRDVSLKSVPAGQTPLSRRELVERIIADALPVRFQLQMHKVIWEPSARGV